MKSLPVLAALALLSMTAGCSIGAEELKAESISFPTSGATTPQSADSSPDAPAASETPSDPASEASAQSPAGSEQADAQAMQDSAAAGAGGAPANAGGAAASAGQPAAPDSQPPAAQQNVPSQTSQDAAVAGVAAWTRASKQGDDALPDSVIQAYARCLVARAWNSLGPTARADMASGADDDNWRLNSAEEDAVDAAKDYCESATPGFD